MAGVFKTERITLTTLLLSILFFNCQKENDPIVTALPEKAIQNESYGSDASQKIDIFLPAGRSTMATKALFLIHEGRIDRSFLFSPLTYP